MGIDRLVAAGALVAAVATAPTPPAAPALVTQAESGRTYRLALGRETTLRLSSRWTWSEPRAGRGLELTPVEYFVDPGFSEWRVRGVARGAFTIRSLGTPGCGACGAAARRFVVTIRVT